MHSEWPEHNFQLKKYKCIYIHMYKQRFRGTYISVHIYIHILINKPILMHTK
jgi:hypothetical protein